MSERSCSDGFFEEVEEAEDESGDMESYDDERDFPYKGPVLFNCEFMSSARLRYRSMALCLNVGRHRLSAAPVKKTLSRRVLLRWGLDQGSKKEGDWNGKL